jgi:hypothetical protein
MDSRQIKESNGVSLPPHMLVDKRIFNGECISWRATEIGLSCRHYVTLHGDLATIQAEGR